MAGSPPALAGPEGVGLLGAGERVAKLSAVLTDDGPDPKSPD